MAEVPETQEQFFGRPPWMAEVPETQEQFFGFGMADSRIIYGKSA
jgi:hypothetical protein